MDEKLVNIRSALTALTNSGGVDPAYNSVEIDAQINKQIVDASPKFSVLRNVIPRESMNGQLTDIWRVRTSDNDSGVSGYSTSEGGSNTNTPGQGDKVQLTATAATMREDWEVENYFLLGSASAYDAVADEIMNALETHIDREERAIINGDDTGAYGTSGNFQGMKQLVNSFAGSGDTTSVFGIARASGKTYLDSQYVDADSGAFSLSMLDDAINAQKKVKGQPGFFLCSIDRKTEIEGKLQAQQRFMGTLNLEGGFTVSTYKAVPIVEHVYADKLGASDDDTAIILTSRDNFVMKVLDETKQISADLGRNDAVGGYIRTIEVLKCKDLTKNVLIDAIAVPA